MLDRQVTNSTAIWPLSCWHGASSAISSNPCFLLQVVNAPFKHRAAMNQRRRDARLARKQRPGALVGQWQRLGSCAHARKTAAKSGRSDAGHCSPQQYPHNAPHPALLLPVRSQSTHAADPPSSARNSGSFVPPEPTSQLASLWCDGAANHFLCFRSGARMRVQQRFHTMG